MNVRAIIFGGIGTLVETSELQRKAFNEAFAEAGIPWHWDISLYRRLLYTPGGRNRIRSYSKSRGDGAPLGEQQISALHERKSALFQEALAASRLEPRSGVQSLINQAKDANVRLAVASTTSESNIKTLLVASTLRMSDFDVILNRDDVENAKPAPDIYRKCLAALGVSPSHAIAIEDSDSGVDSAIAAGLKCIALPGENTAAHDFSGASLVVAGRAGGVGGGERYASRITRLTLASCDKLLSSGR